MRRPITAWLLLLFLAAQLYGLSGRLVPTTAPEPYQKVTNVPTGLVHTDGQTYLIGESGAWTLTAAGGRVSLVPVNARWVDVPQPSGQGIWRVLATPSGIPLVGLGGPLYPEPTGQHTLWIDPGNHLAYISNGVTDLTAIGGLTVQQARWARQGGRAALYADGPDGVGIYLWVEGATPSLVMATGAEPVTSLGIDTAGRAVAALANGQVWQQGHTTPVWTGQKAYVASDGVVLGFLADGRAVWWRAGLRLAVNVPAVPTSPPQFGQGLLAAYIGQVGNHAQLIEVIRSHVVVDGLPGRTVHLVGFLGTDPVVTVLDPKTAGTYVLETPLATQKTRQRRT
jgi:hypothetical protein